MFNEGEFCFWWGPGERFLLVFCRGGCFCGMQVPEYSLVLRIQCQGGTEKADGFRKVASPECQ